ncbi:MAG: M13 family metallopeptidase, partial [Friedmanniella sp.]
TYTLLTAAELRERAPGFAWDAWLEGLGAPEGAFAEIVVRQPSFVEAAATLWQERPLAQWQAWLALRTASACADFLSEAVVQQDFAFYGRTLSGTPQIKDRWKRGVALVEDALGEAVGKVYVEQHFSPAAKERMDGLVANLIEAYRRSITELEWMTEETKEQALDKLAKFRPHIGYPSRWRDYSALEIRADDPIGNVMRAAAFEVDRSLAKIGSPIDREEWLMTPQTVNAYYHPLRNEIVFPAAILQPPFFNENADDAVNYGGIGAVIGHEIGHGFDDQGSTCDGDGALRDWWTPKDREAFETRTAALVEQYDALSPELADGQHVNGRLTIGENIGDLGGLTIAYLAHQIATEGARPEPIDGYSPEQRLFLSWGAIWQSKARPEAVLQRLATDPHSPNEFRCNQIVRNLDAFHAAFGVTESDRLWLAEEQRVKIW